MKPEIRRIQQDLTLKISVPAGSASSAGRHAWPLRGQDPAPPLDAFTLHGKKYQLIRWYPGDEQPAPVPAGTSATCEVDTTAGPVLVQGYLTATTSQLWHLVWIDDTGEALGAWTPAPEPGSMPLVD